MGSALREVAGTGGLPARSRRLAKSHLYIHPQRLSQPADLTVAYDNHLLCSLAQELASSLLLRMSFNTRTVERTAWAPG